MTPGIADTILQAFTSQLFNQVGLMQGDAFWLIGQLAQWYLLLYALPVMMMGMHHAMGLLLTALTKISMLFWLVQNFQHLANTVLNWVVGTGLLVTGNHLTPAEFLSPGTVLFHGFNVTLPMVTYLENLSLWGKVTNIGLGATFQGSTAFVSFCFYVMAAHVMVLVIVFQLCVVRALLVIPALIFKPAAFLGTSMLQNLIKVTWALGTLAAVTGVIVPMLTILAFPEGQEPTHWSVLSQAFAAFVFAVISLSVPWIMSLHGGTLIGAATGMVLGGARRVVSRL